MKRTLIHNALIVNEGICTQGSLVIEGGKIAEVLTHGKPLSAPCDDTIDATGCYLIPGVIDEHVHMREPGMTEKADISSESRAAAAGGVTSIMDMPNNNPQITSLDALDMKMGLLDEKCIVNHACYYGATNANYKDFAKLPAHRIAGIKVFMGSSTGNMLVNDVKSLLQIFTGTDRLIAAHCEDMKVINHNIKLFQSLYAQGEVPLNKHPFIRSEEASLQLYTSRHNIGQPYRSTLTRTALVNQSRIASFPRQTDWRKTYHKRSMCATLAIQSKRI